jgi:hypothetical protein
LGAGSGTTLGQAARTVYAISSTADVTQTTAASQPLLLAHSGVNYWWGSGVSGNYCSTPNAAANQITGNQYEIIAQLSFVANGNLSVITKGDYNGANYMLEIRGGLPTFIFTTVSSGTASIQAPTSLGTFDGYIKVTKNVGTYTIYSSTDGINYTSLVSSSSGIVPVSYNANLQIGQVEGLSRNYVGNIKRLTISNSIGGAPVVDFNPATYNAAVSQTSWTSSTSEIWTINTGTAATGYKGVLVDRTVMQGDYIDDHLNSAYNRSSINTTFIGAKGFTNDNSGSAIIVKSSSYSNIVIFGSSGTFVWMNTYASNVNVSRVVNSLEIYTLTNNSGVNNAISKNNGTENTNTYTPNNMGSGLFLMNCNLCLNTYIELSFENTTPQKTSMYNVLKTMNLL